MDDPKENWETYIATAEPGLMDEAKSGERNALLQLAGYLFHKAQWLKDQADDDDWTEDQVQLVIEALILLGPIAHTDEATKKIHQAAAGFLPPHILDVVEAGLSARGVSIERHPDPESLAEEITRAVWDSVDRKGDEEEERPD